MNTVRNNAALPSLGLLILRLGLGVVFAAHGWQKFFQFTLEGAAGAFAQMGVPAAEFVAPLAATLELAGGVALILGVATRIVGILLGLEMLVAGVLVHLPAGMFVADGGVELVLVLAVGALALAPIGPGRYAVDALFVGGSKRSERSLAS
ncbi:DoxX family protein [Glutamicibacter sp. X7]